VSIVALDGGASLYKREESPSLVIFFLPHRQARGVRGDFQKRCLFNSLKIALKSSPLPNAGED
jgi:hypothetical protein